MARIKAKHKAGLIVAAGMAAIVGGALVTGEKKDLKGKYYLEKHGGGYSVYEVKDGKKDRQLGKDLSEEQAKFFKDQ